VPASYASKQRISDSINYNDYENSGVTFPNRLLLRHFTFAETVEYFIKDGSCEHCVVLDATNTCLLVQSVFVFSFSLFFSFLYRALD